MYKLTHIAILAVFAGTAAWGGEKLLVQLDSDDYDRNLASLQLMEYNGVVARHIFPPKYAIMDALKVPEAAGRSRASGATVYTVTDILDHGVRPDNWYPAADTQTFSEIVQGLDWLAQESFDRGVKVVWVHAPVETILTMYEPITGRTMPPLAVTARRVTLTLFPVICEGKWFTVLVHTRRPKSAGEMRTETGRPIRLT